MDGYTVDGLSIKETSHGDDQVYAIPGKGCISLNPLVFKISVAV